MKCHPVYNHGGSATVFLAQRRGLGKKGFAVAFPLVEGVAGCPRSRAFSRPGIPGSRLSCDFAGCPSYRAASSSNRASVSGYRRHRSTRAAACGSAWRAPAPIFPAFSSLMRSLRAKNRTRAPQLLPRIQDQLRIHFSAVARPRPITPQGDLPSRWPFIDATPVINSSKISLFIAGPLSSKPQSCQLDPYSSR